MFSCKRQNKTGGGVFYLCLVKQKNNVDVVFLQIKLHLKKFMIRLIYRQPSDRKLYDQIIEVHCSLQFYWKLIDTAGHKIRIINLMGKIEYGRHRQ